MNTVSIKIRAINQLTGDKEIDNGDGIEIQDYKFEVMDANANAMADMMPDCEIHMVASNGDFVILPSRNMMKDEAEMSEDDFYAKWYPGFVEQIHAHEQEDWDQKDSICH